VPPGGQNNVPLLALALMIFLATACAAPSSPAQPAPAASAPASAAPEANAVAAFYRGKTVRLVIGFAPGGGYDTYARLIARHMPQYLPGRPQMIVENRPGAGSLLAANTVYAVEPRDGAVLLSLNENAPLLQALGAPGVQFDARQFGWLGAAVRTTNVCHVRKETGIQTIQDSIAGRPAILATTGPGTQSHDVAAVLNPVLDSKLKLVQGYAGTAQMRLAVEGGEVDGFCMTVEGLTNASFRDLVDGPNAPSVPIVVLNAEALDLPFLAGTPVAERLAPTEEGRALLRAVDAPAQISRPYAVAPGVPAERLEALRQALARTLADPDFLGEAQRSSLTVSPVSGPEVSRLVEDLLNTPSATLARLKDVLQ
jgi:tripartite-type tricarboxylate transporter receptor subunit TctC